MDEKVKEKYSSLKPHEKMEFESKIYPTKMLFGFIWGWDFFASFFIIFDSFDPGHQQLAWTLPSSLILSSGFLYFTRAFRLRLNKKGVTFFTLLFLITSFYLFRKFLLAV